MTRRLMPLHFECLSHPEQMFGRRVKRMTKAMFEATDSDLVEQGLQINWVDVEGSRQNGLRLKVELS